MLRSLTNLLQKSAKGFTLNVEPAAVELFAFNSPKVVDRWHTFTDAYFGGKSQAALVYNAQEQAAEFSGRVTLELSEDADIHRAGYAVASSKVLHIGDYWDLTGCSHLVLDVKGDGRTYIANVRTDSIAGTGGDVWQAPFKTRASEWQQVRVPLDGLLLTYQGQLVQQQLQFPAHQVISVGVTVSALAEAGAGEGAPVEAFQAAETSSSQQQQQDAASSSADAAAGSVAEASGQGSAASSTSSTSDVAESSGSSEGHHVPDSSVEQHSQAAGDVDTYPDHERFKLLIRRVYADVEW